MVSIKNGGENSYWEHMWSINLSFITAIISYHICASAEK